jgi:hypothetical protein
MFSLAIGADELETAAKKYFKKFYLRVHFEDGNHLEFILKNKYSFLSDLELKTDVSCDPSAGKIIASNLHVKTYSDKKRGVNRINSGIKEYTFDLVLSFMKKILLSLAPRLSDSVICKESDDAYSFSLRQLAKIKMN